MVSGKEKQYKNENLSLRYTSYETVSLMLVSSRREQGMHGRLHVVVPRLQDLIIMQKYWNFNQII